MRHAFMGESWLSWMGLRAHGWWLALMLLASGSRLEAEERLSPKLAMVLMLKALTYDQNFGSHGSGEFVVLFVHGSGHQRAAEEVLNAVAELKGTRIQGRPLRFIKAELKDASALRALTQEEQVAAVVALPGLPAHAVTSLAEVARAQRIYTLTLEPSFAEKELAVGVISNKGRMQLLINLSAARQVGASFEPTVLQLAKVLP